MPLQSHPALLKPQHGGEKQFSLLAPASLVPCPLSVMAIRHPPPPLLPLTYRPLPLHWFTVVSSQQRLEPQQPQRPQWPPSAFSVAHPAPRALAAPPTWSATAAYTQASARLAVACVASASACDATW